VETIGLSVLMITAEINEKAGGATDRSDRVEGSACSVRQGAGGLC